MVLISLVLICVNRHADLCIFFHVCSKSELSRPILRNSVESDHRCTSKIYFDNSGDNVTLTLYNVTLTSQNHLNTITSVIAAKQTVINKVMFFR